MPTAHPLSGIYAAAVTPLHPDSTLDLDNIPRLLEFLKQRGCHGALLLGTTGEGPSFSPGERRMILHAAQIYCQANPAFHFLAGTGTPSLQETIELTREAFELGAKAVVVLPPYYFRKVSDAGLYTWFEQVLRAAVPEGKYLLGYHIPPISGVPLSLDLLERLKNAYPTRFAGIKDSSGDSEFAKALGQRFGSDLFVLTGNDRLLSLAMQNSASGCITAMANVTSPFSRQLWDAHIAGHPGLDFQHSLDAAREVMDQYPPAPPLLKQLLARQFNFPLWSVRPPLLPLDKALAQHATSELSSLLL